MRHQLRHRYGRARRGHARFDPSDFDLRGEVSEGAVVHDARGGGYNVTFSGRSLGHFKSRGGALKAITREMDRQKYWPNTFYVNDHGNTTLLSVRDNPKGKGVLTRHIYSWV